MCVCGGGGGGGGGQLSSTIEHAIMMIMHPGHPQAAHAHDSAGYNLAFCLWLSINSPWHNCHRHR